MLRFIVLILAFLTWNTPLIQSYPCANNLVPEADYTCASALSDRQFDSVALNMPSGQTAMSFIFDVMITDYCTSGGTMPTPFRIATLSYGSGTVTRFVDFYMTQTSTTNLVLDVNAAGNNNIASVTAPAPLNVWMSLAITLDTSSNYAASAFYTTSDFRADVPSPGPTISSASLTDSTMKLTLCSDYDGTNAVGCSIRNLVFMYKAFTSFRIAMVAGKEANLMASYQFREGSGYSTANNGGSLTKAYFGASTDSSNDVANSPSWYTTDTSIQFTARNQYLKIPTFTHGLFGLQTPSFGIGVFFWIKLTEAPSSSDKVFQYSSSDLTTARYAFQIESSRKVSVLLGSATLTSTSQTLTLNQWTAVFFALGYYRTANHGYGVANFGTAQAIPGTNMYPSSAAAIDFQATDVIHLGHFKGYIADLRIYSKTTMLFNSPSCDSNCPFDIGNSNPPVCIQPTCGRGGYAVSSCFNCPNACGTCTSSGACQTCPSGQEVYNGNCVTALICTSSQFKDGRTCKECSSVLTGCLTCNSATQCTSCSSQYFWTGKACTLCPTSKYSLSATASSCKGDCSTGCKRCADSTAAQCLSCLPQYSFTSGSGCALCPTAKYALSDTAGTCAGDCSTGCARCADSTAAQCSSCQPQYSFTSGSGCTLCPNSKYSLSGTAGTCAGNCATGCKRCADSTAAQCSSCLSQYSFTSGSGCSLCPTAKYSLSDTAGTCAGDCSTGCARCADSTAAQCASCQPQYSFTSGSGCTLCGDGLYSLSGTAGTCGGNCATGCKRCADSTAAQCSSCLSQYSFTSGSGCSLCPASKYASTDTSGTCTENCATGCSRCTDSTAASCSNCLPQYSFTSGSGCALCPASQYSLSGTAGTCAGNCATGCTRCADSTAAQCSSCSSEYFFTSGSGCTLCPASKYSATGTSGTCTEDCSTGCTRCSSSTSCSTCSTAYFWTGSACTVCPVQKYASTGTSGSCTEDCPATCQTCSDTSNCFSCSSGLYAFTSPNCSSCPDGYYALSATSTTCTGLCSRGCKTCSDSSTCVGCLPGFTQAGTKCKVCQTGKYPLTASAATCAGDCPAGCKVCIDSTTCYTCPTGYELIDSICQKPEPVIVEAKEPFNVSLIVVFSLVSSGCLLLLAGYLVKKRLIQKFTGHQQRKVRPLPRNLTVQTPRSNLAVQDF